MDLQGSGSVVILLDLVLIEGNWGHIIVVPIGIGWTVVDIWVDLIHHLINNGMDVVMVNVVTDYLIPLRDHFVLQVQVTVVSIELLVDIKITIVLRRVLVKMSMHEDILRHAVVVGVGNLVSKVLVVARILLYWW